MHTEAPALRHIRNILLLALAGIVAWQIGMFLLVAFAGVLLAVAIGTPAELMARHTGLGQPACVLVVAAMLLGIAAGAAIAVAPSVAIQIDELRDKVPELVELAKRWVDRYEWGRELLEGGKATDIAVSSRLWGALSGAFSGTFGALANAVLVLFVGLYLAADPGLYRRGLLAITPSPWKSRAAALLEECTSVLARWLLGTLVSMSVVGTLTWLGLSLLGVPLALTLALLAMAFAFIPNIGPVLSAVPAVMLGLLEGPRQAAYVVALYVAVQTVESYLVTPFIQKQTVRLPPVLTLCAQFLLGLLAGAIGLLVATPLAAVGLTVVKRLLDPANKSEGHQRKNPRAPAEDGILPVD